MTAPARKPFLLRLDPRLYAELEAWAQQELRSVNGQIEHLLRQAVQRRKGQPGAPSPLPPQSDADASGSAPSAV